MILKFKNDRLATLLQIKGIPATAIETKLGLRIDKWVSGKSEPRDFETVLKLAEALQVPAGLFYYEKIEAVRASFEELVFVVVETGEEFTIKLK